MEGIYQTTGINVIVSGPVVQDGAELMTLTKSLATYGHESTATHGFDRANITFNANRADLGMWLKEGLGRDIDVRDSAGVQVWNGIVDTVQASGGGRTVTVGPLSDIANRISVYYALLIEETDPPSVGPRDFTEFAENMDSQQKYGTWEKIISGGTLTEALALNARDAALAKYGRQPSSYSFTTVEDASVTLNCYGYWKWLDSFAYVSGLADVGVLSSDKIKLILAEAAAINPGVISIDYTQVQTTDVIVPLYDERMRKALEVIKECVSFGSGGTVAAPDVLPWVFGIYENRMASFNPVPDKIDYEHKLAYGTEARRLGGSPVEPWHVKPGRWLFMPDSIPGGGLPYTRTQFYDDPRVAFIERVRYDAPRGFTAEGIKAKRGSELLARWGLGSF